MNTFIQNTLLVYTIFLLNYHLFLDAQSTIFTWEEGSSKINSQIKGSLSENNWYGENVSFKDLQFYQSLFCNDTVMSFYGDGQIRTPENTNNRINIWTERFKKGQPHGGMTIFHANNNEPIGYIVAGGGDVPGASEVAYAYVPEVWGNGIGSNVIENFVTKWAPEVRRIGLGIELDEIKDKEIINKFQCFSGKTLERLDATASPSNIGSWKILLKNKFTKADSGTSNNRKIIEVDNEQCCISGKINYEAMEKHIIEKYFTQTQELKEGIRYLMIDPEGNERTLSKHKGYNRLKYHFEYNLP